MTKRKAEASKGEDQRFTVRIREADGDVREQHYMAAGIVAALALALADLKRGDEIVILLKG